jgi:hypothetical protein
VLLFYKVPHGQALVSKGGVAAGLVVTYKAQALTPLSYGLSLRRSVADLFPLLVFFSIFFISLGLGL